MSELRRRTILGLLVSLPAFVISACKRRADKRTPERQAKHDAAPAEPGAEALLEPFRTIVRVIGPWRQGQESQADEFTARFVASERSKPFLPRIASLGGLAASLSGYPTGAAEIDLGKLSTEDRQFLLELTALFYSINEIRFVAAGLPLPGTCVGGDWHTRPPA